MISNCPKCDTELTRTRDDQRYIVGYCPQCLAYVWTTTCTACNEDYPVVALVKERSCWWHNHHCTNKRHTNRNRALSTEERAPRTPTEIERYEEGLRMLEEDD